MRLRDPVWMTNFRLHHRAAKHYQSGRVFLAGDAAHIHSPAGAQGMSTGIQDAANLAWKLAAALHGICPASIVDSYQIERAPIGRAVLRTSDRAFTIATSTNPVVRFARTRLAPAVIPLVLKAKLGRAYMFRTVSQLGIGYRNSPLSADAPGVRRRLRAGDRLPDAPIAAGSATSLHRLTAKPGWHLLLCGGDGLNDVTRLVNGRPDVFAVQHLHGPGNEQALARLGIKLAQQTILLVRPDGHIGFQGTGIAGLASYLDRWLPVRP
ncbi:FAD-dependent monooxygenase [Catelliglobosispora koreensis]|uniref:FAD-dependent monooxygenase n=1 Tax=Catelliglobosispora koreensis TaxID=129052 RepID=UPI00039F120E|nr:FAD-dependent monooxygenase [Catelliglobosispora koreensis]